MAPKAYKFYIFPRLNKTSGHPKTSYHGDQSEYLSARRRRRQSGYDVIRRPCLTFRTRQPRNFQTLHGTARLYATEHFKTHLKGRVVCLEHANLELDPDGPLCLQGISSFHCSCKNIVKFQIKVLYIESAAREYFIVLLGLPNTHRGYLSVGYKSIVTWFTIKKAFPEKL